MRQFAQYCLLVASIIVAGCAQQSTPTGGVKDTIPPKIVESSPQNFALNYEGNSIELKFDEYVKISSLKEQLIITPSLQFEPEFQLKGKTLKVSFIDSLKSNTTYQFNFGEGVKDLNENNPLDSNLFIFSTGNYLDSLSVSGQVKDAYTLEPLEEVLVMLYEGSYDSIPYKERPTYFSKTDEQGRYQIKYLPDGEFKMVAIKDENKNYLFDPISDMVGFPNTRVSSRDTAEYPINMFNEEYDNQYVKSTSSSEYGKVTFIFNQPIENPTASLIGQSFKKQWYIEDASKNGDTLTYWITESLDTVSFCIRDGDIIIDTVDVIMAPKPGDKQWEKKRLSVSVNAKRKGEIALFDTLRFTSLRPVTGYDEKLILLVENEKDTLDVKLGSVDQSLKEFYYSYQWKESSAYKLVVLPGTFEDFMEIQNDTIKADFKTTTWNKYADVELTMDIPETVNFAIVQLLGKQQAILQEDKIATDGIIKYKHLLPGQYALKMIYDTNNNGEWDTGKLIGNKQAERVIYYSGRIEVRSGWDVDLVWKIEN